jgi:hypothetical protein
MEPKEKALELFIKYRNIIIDDVLDKKPIYFIMNDKMAKQCALYALEFSKEFITGDLSEAFDKTMYLLEVKEEIEKL